MPKNLTIELGLDPFEIEVKRFYFPCVVKTTCPECGEPCKQDFTEDYLSYPRVNAPEKVHFYCLGCDHEFDIKVKLTINVEPVED